MWNAREESRSQPAAPQPVAQQVVAQQAQPTKAPTKAWIGPSVSIKGDVSSAEDLTIEGQVEGTIEVGDNNLIVGVGASITAALVAHTITISGAVNGNVTASDTIEIRAQGSVEGNLKAPHIAVRDGALLHGRVDTYQPASADERPRFPIAV